MLESRQLNQFLTIARYKSFRLAAKELNLSQPALSRSIQRLEEELDAQLFYRETQGISLTLFGEALLPKATAIVNSLNETQQMMDALKGGESGELKIAFGPVYGDLLGSSSIGEFSQLYPKVNVCVKIGSFTEMIEELALGNVDIFIGETSSITPKNKYWIHPLKKRIGMCCCRADHPIFDLVRIEYSDITRYPLLTPQLPIRLLPFVKRTEDQTLVDKESFFYSNIHCNSVPLAKGIIKKSDVIAILLVDGIKSEVECGELRVIRVTEPKGTSNGGIVRLAAKDPSPPVQRYISLLKKLDNSL